MTEEELNRIGDLCDLADRDEKNGFRDQMPNLSGECRALIAEVRRANRAIKKCEEIAAIPVPNLLGYEFECGQGVAADDILKAYRGEEITTAR